MTSQQSKVIKEGWMTKQGGIIKTWKKRWFVLNGDILHYYLKPGGREKGQINITDAKIIDTAPECRKQPAFKINIPGIRTYYIISDSMNDVKDWIETLETVRVGKSNVNETNTVSLNDFDLIRVHGRGSYGKVQLVRNKSDHQLYAMKTMSKRLLQEFDQIEQTIAEKNVLMQTVFPFLVGAHFSFQTDAKIFMVLDYVPGGELFNRLKEEGKFSESRTQLYAAEILLGLGHLHSLGFVYRDLKPENVLVDAEGHLKITDFGLVKTNLKNAKDTTTTFCGTPEYIAPEILQQQPYTKGVDWWSYGVLLYEMLTGLPPFYHENTNRMYQMIINEQVDLQHRLSNVAKDLIVKLLDKDQKTRFGSGEQDAEEIKLHPFFKGLNWDDVKHKRTQPQWVPSIRNDTDTSNFDQEFTQEEAMISFEDGSLINAESQDAFVDFTVIKDSVIPSI
ncbi:AGC family protein kinase [Tritrichomonas foetus]|uniref:non-specific serine/threonine protein kinase n=1 Tax=Tritrichomonas foetus TaxID=1144522 RepID=A0A1J4KKG1_9EUKA|nr:AGC family protein kinase [Tritrichomonas foetus]|eukprot:OHT11416.1 AGC family protein kinase [Tritrichomonas foetus]